MSYALRKLGFFGLEVRELATDEDADEPADEARRFDGPSKRFAKFTGPANGWLASDWEQLDSALSAAQSEQDQQAEQSADLRRAEEDLEEWLRRRRESGGTGP